MRVLKSIKDARLTKTLTCEAIIVALLVGGLSFSGCGAGDQTGGTGKKSGVIAKAINDGANPMNPYQAECPVCGAPIDPDIHTEGDMDRVYFDRQECLEKWKQDTATYKKKLMEKRPQVLPEEQQSGKK